MIWSHITSSSTAHGFKSSTDWEAAFLNDRYLDLAYSASFFADGT